MGRTKQPRSKLEELAQELAQELKTPEDLSNLTAQLTKMTVEAALNAEMDHHIGYPAHDPDGYNSSNNRNGYSSKTLKLVLDTSLL